MINCDVFPSGHGGRQIVDFLEEGLETNIKLELKLPDDASIQERLTRAFLITDMQSRKLNITTSGMQAYRTAASRCFVHFSRTPLHVF